jgi:putative spermidine/putrescine transport system ATP-binding protein
MSYLSLKGITKEFDDFTAVKNFNLDIKKGEFVSLLGPSGCGKTTTLQMIGGFLEPTNGSIILEGNDITLTKPNKRDFGIVFQTYALFPHMDVFANVSFGLETRKMPKEMIKEKVNNILALVKLDNFKHRYPAELSGGQRQRVAIARSLVYEPSLLLLDEPLSNLDAKLRENMQIELREIQQKTGTTTLLVTHDQQEAMALSDRVVVMNSGNIEQVGNPQFIYNHPGSFFTLDFLGKSNKLSGDIIVQDDKYMLKIEDFSLEIKANLTKENVNFYIRPEKIIINIDDEIGLKAKVKSKLFLGIYIVYVFTRENAEDILVYTQEKYRDIEVGENVHLNWRSSDIICFQGD